MVVLKEAFLSLVQASEDTGLKVNEDKTKYIVNGNGTIIFSAVSVGCYNFHKVESFVSLGTVVNSDGGVIMAIKVRLGVANKCCFSLKKHLNSKLLSCKVECLMYVTLIRPWF